MKMTIFPGSSLDSIYLGETSNGGYKLGSALLIIVLIMRYFQGGENGFYIAVIIFSVIGIITILLSKHFLQIDLKKS